MNVGQGIKMAFSSIWANKMRSMLTMLGIIIGVTAVIALVALGQGTTKQVTEQVQGLGSTLLTVTITGRGTATALDYNDAIMMTDIEGISSAAPVNTQNATVKFGRDSVSVNIIGTNSSYLDVQSYALASGRFIGQIDLDLKQKVAVIGSATAEELFGLDDPVGQYVLINGIRHKIVGLLAEKGDSSAGSNDELVIVPLTTAERVFRSLGVRTIYVQVDSEEQMDSVSSRLEQELASHFRGNTNSYRLFSQQDLLATVTSVSDTLTVALGGIAAISLIVGGIGIMNIMLVSVTERTREIGIRKAIGARKRDILLQFLIEAIVLSGSGGLLGIAFGYGVSQLVSRTMNMDVVYSLDVTLLAVGFSIAIGVLFGIFPANKAARLKPIEALRFD
jgi:putative ABC transport system permease protein